MKKLLKKLINLLKRLLGLLEDEKVVTQPEEKPEEVVTQPEPEQEKPEKPEDHEEKLEDPEESDFENAKIDSFLWKPESDNDGKPVVLISCDNMKCEDVKLRIINKNGKKVKVGIRNSGHRANKEGHQKYGRIHFRLDRTASSLKRPAPLTLQFYHTLGKRGKAVVIKQFKVKKVEERKYVS